jgi:hypothetical protein
MIAIFLTFKLGKNLRVLNLQTANRKIILSPPPEKYEAKMYIAQNFI